MSAPVVVKYGGHAMADPAAFATAIAAMDEPPVIVHGGGPQISAMLDRFGIVSQFEQGQRVTTPEMMRIVRMVLLATGKDVVTQLNLHGLRAVSLCGEDAGLFTAVRVPQDIGLVGDIDAIDPRIVLDLRDKGYIPVVATISPDKDGVAHNVNADTGAAALAVALAAQRLVMLTDVPGLYRDWPDRSSLIGQISAAQVEELLPSLEKGMVPKMQACLRAVRGGVPSALVGSDLTHGTVVTA
jgi:acetylglutamate kinase